MRKNFNVPFLDFDKKAIVEGEKEALIKFSVVSCLQQVVGTVSGEEKYSRYKLIDKIMEAGDGETDISSTDIILIKKCVGESNASPLAVGRIFDFLEE